LKKLTGYTSLIAVGKDFSTLLADGPHSDNYRQVWGRILQHRSFSGPVTPLTKAGERHGVDLIVAPVLDHRSQIANLVCSCIDVRRANALACEAEALPSAVPYSQEIAHTLNTVLTCAMAYADSTCEMLPIEHPLRSRLEDMKRNAHRAANLVRLLLADDAPAPSMNFAVICS
jgi:PAS domain S-box-containing protein